MMIVWKDIKTQGGNGVCVINVRERKRGGKRFEGLAASVYIPYFSCWQAANPSRQTSAEVFQAGYQRRRSKPACPLASCAHPLVLASIRRQRRQQEPRRDTAIQAGVMKGDTRD